MTVSLLPGTPPSRRRWQALLSMLRGLLGVALLLAGAFDAFITACIGIAPIGPRLLELRDAIADRYRLARANAREGEIIDDKDEK